MNDHVPDDVRDRLTAALGIRRLVEEVADGWPYASTAALVAAAVAAATPLSDAELDEAVSHHPRIGEKAAGDGTAQRLSALEQGGLDAAAEGVDAGIARGNQVYEERFGRVFLIRAAGRDREEILGELQRRLLNAPDDEAEESKEQLRQIMALRLGVLFEEQEERP